MSLHFLNPLMLIGLAGLALPILVHLLNRKRYDVVEWGAMQFLELGRTRRRRMRLEQLLLLLLRLGLVALVVLAMSRPWTRGGLFSNLGAASGRDVVFVIDGSYSMGWEGAGITPHARAVGWIHKFCEELGSGDTVSVIDARETPHSLIEAPTHDFAEARATLNKLTAPAGTTNLPTAVTQAARVLGTTSNPSREIVVLTDGQARGWFADDDALWTRFDVLRDDAVVRPQMFVVEMRQPPGGTLENFHVERLELSREVTVADFPVRIETRVGYSGVKPSVTRNVSFEVDGQRLADGTVQVQLAPGQPASVEFEHRFREPGSHVVSVLLERDNLPADDRSDAGVTVAETIPLLIVDGSPHLDPTQTESYFATAALSAKDNETPWVRAKVISAAELNAAALNDAEVVFLANVKNITAEQGDALSKFVAAGGGLLVAPGDHVDAASYRVTLDREERGLLPAPLDRIASSEKPADGIHIDPASLDVLWLRAFRDDHQGGFVEARFTRWWKIAPPSEAAKPDQPATQQNVEKPAESKVGSQPKLDIPDRRRESLVAAKFDNGDAFVVEQLFGMGRVVLLTVPIDADWSTLPAKSDYVPFLHELVFHLSSGKSPRNLDGLNDDRRESDLRPLTAEEKTILGSGDRMAFVTDLKEVQEAVRTDGAPSEFWRLLMLGFVGFLICEAVMTRHLVKGGHAVVEERETATAALPE